MHWKRGDSMGKLLIDLKKVITSENQKMAISLLIFLMMLFLALVLISWLAGYWLNALYGYKFEINSCWQGVGAVVAGLGGVAALAGSAWIKLWIDSKYNSVLGEKPEGGKE